MRFTISSSSSENIDNAYKESAQHLLDYLVTIDNAELNWESRSTSIMGQCFDTFKKAGKEVYGYTTSKYTDDLKNLPNCEHRVYGTTYELKKEIFDDADVIICLAGGTSTISEIFSHLEEIRSNDQDKLLVIYDENHHFDTTLNLIKDLIERKFNDESIYNYFKVANNVDEFKKY